MSAPDWQTANVTDPAPVVPPDKLFDLLEEAIDTQAAAFPEPAKFRNAVYYILTHAETLNVDAIAAALAWQRLERIFSALEHFRDPEITLDAMRCLAGMNREQGVFMADLARKHGITRVALHRRVLRLAKFLGVEYQRTKPRPPKPAPLYGVGGFIVTEENAGPS